MVERAEIIGVFVTKDSSEWWVCTRARNSLESILACGLRSLVSRASCCLVAWRVTNRRQPKLYADASTVQHVDERFDAEQLNLPADQVAYPRLRYSEKFGGGALRELACLDKPFEFRHQLRAQAQALRLFWFEPEVPKHVSRRTLDFHCLLLIFLAVRRFNNSRSRDRAKSKSAFGVFCVFFSKACRT